MKEQPNCNMGSIMVYQSLSLLERHCQRVEASAEVLTGDPSQQLTTEDMLGGQVASLPVEQIVKHTCAMGPGCVAQEKHVNSCACQHAKIVYVFYI